MAQDNTTPQVEFGVGQLLSHTPMWAKKVLLMLGSILSIFNIVIEAAPTLVPVRIEHYVNVGIVILTGIFSMFGLKNPFISTPDNKDIPATSETVVTTDTSIPKPSQN